MDGKREPISITDFEASWMGKRVRSKVRFDRTRRYVGEGAYRVDLVVVEAPVRGWVVGLRWKQRGTSTFAGYEESNVWRCEGIEPVALVATSARAEPVWVPFGALQTP